MNSATSSHGRQQDYVYPDYPPQGTIPPRRQLDAPPAREERIPESRVVPRARHVHMLQQPPEPSEERQGHRGQEDRHSIPRLTDG